MHNHNGHDNSNEMVDIQKFNITFCEGVKSLMLDYLEGRVMEHNVALANIIEFFFMFKNKFDEKYTTCDEFNENISEDLILTKMVVESLNIAVSDPNPETLPKTVEASFMFFSTLAQEYCRAYQIDQPVNLLHEDKETRSIINLNPALNAI